MSDTPRMKAAQQIAMEHMTGDVWRVGCELERELVAANDYIQRLEDELIEAKGQWAALVADVVLYEDRGERIKRLEEAGSEMQKWLLSYDEHYVYALNVINNWNKAKESK